MAKFIKPNGNVQAWNSVIKTSALDYDLLEETTFFTPNQYYHQTHLHINQ
ncbi:hypothetical protein [Spiroplasma sp. ChiS]|nr:hypothetical protein [Spiroplasma sp. ChiS]